MHKVTSPRASDTGPHVVVAALSLFVALVVGAIVVASIADVLALGWFGLGLLLVVPVLVVLFGRDDRPDRR